MQGLTCVVDARESSTVCCRLEDVFTVENGLSAFTASMSIVITNLYRFKRLACNGGCNIFVAEAVVRSLSDELGLVNTAFAIGISCDSISSSVVNLTFQSAMTSGANVSGVNSALAREAAAT